MKTNKKKKDVQYIPGAADDGLGFFPVITCEVTRGRETKVLWVVHHQRRQVPTKDSALAAAESELALAFATPSLPSSPERFLDHLRQRGFSELSQYKVAESYEQDRRSALGDDYQPAFGDEAARNDPVLHASLMEMVNEQMAENDPPETRETVERLLAAGYSPEYARRMIGFLIVYELTEGMFHKTPFNQKRYIENLRRLPELPPKE